MTLVMISIICNLDRLDALLGRDLLSAVVRLGERRLSILDGDERCAHIVSVARSISTQHQLEPLLRIF